MEYKLLIKKEKKKKKKKERKENMENKLYIKYIYKDGEHIKKIVQSLHTLV
jgi:hypothetical protein